MLQSCNLSYAAGKVPLVQNASLEVAPGEVLVIAGANGAGKSTLLKMLCGMLRPAGGSTHIYGQKLQQWKPQQMACFSAVLHQQTVLTLPFKVREVVMMGRYPHYKKTPHNLDETIVTNALLKTGIEELANRNYLELSGGEQQRVHLARVFAQIWYTAHYNTRYLFMDEPSNNLDISHQHRMLTMAREFALEGNCVVVVLHDLNLAMQYAHKMLLLKKGKVIAGGTLAKVMTEKNLSEAYDFPIHLLNHAGYEYPIVIPAIQPLSLTA